MSGVMEELQPTDVAWLAGLLEGEGCFYLDRNGSYAYPAVALKMTDRDIVERAALMVPGPRKAEGLGATVNPAKPSQAGAKGLWRWQVRGTKAVEVMRTVRPYMGERRGAKMDELIKWYAQQSNARRNS